RKKFPGVSLPRRTSFDASMASLTSGAAEAIPRGTVPAFGLALFRSLTAATALAVACLTLTASWLTLAASASHMACMARLLLVFPLTTWRVRLVVLTRSLRRCRRVFSLAVPLGVPIIAISLTSTRWTLFWASSFLVALVAAAGLTWALLLRVYGMVLSTRSVHGAALDLLVNCRGLC